MKCKIQNTLDDHETHFKYALNTVSISLYFTILDAVPQFALRNEKFSIGKISQQPTKLNINARMHQPVILIHHFDAV